MFNTNNGNTCVQLHNGIPEHSYSGDLRTLLVVFILIYQTLLCLSKVSQKAYFLLSSEDVMSAYY